MHSVAMHSCERRTPNYHQVNMNPEFFSNPILQSVPRVIEHQIPLSQRINEVIDYYLNFDSSSIFDKDDRSIDQKDSRRSTGHLAASIRSPIHTHTHELDSAVEHCRRALEKALPGNVHKKPLLPVSENPASVFAPAPETTSSSPRSSNYQETSKSPRLKKRLPVFSANVSESRCSPGSCQRRSQSPQEKQAQSVSDVIRKWNLTTPDPSVTGNSSTASCQKKRFDSPEISKTGSTSQKSGNPAAGKNCPHKRPSKSPCPEGSPNPARARDAKLSQKPNSSRSKTKSFESPIKQSDRSIIEPPEKRQPKSDRSVAKPQDHSPLCRSRIGSSNQEKTPSALDIPEKRLQKSDLAAKPQDHSPIGRARNPEATPNGSRISAVEKLHRVHEPIEEEDDNREVLSIELFRKISTSKVDLKSESLSNLLTRDDCLCHAAVHKSISGVMQSCLENAPAGSGANDPLILAKSSQISNATRVIYRENTPAQKCEPEVARNVGPEVRFKNSEPEESGDKTPEVTSVDPKPEANKPEVATLHAEPEDPTGRDGQVYADFFKPDGPVRGGKKSRRASRTRKSEAVIFEEVQPEAAITRDLELNPRPEKPDSNHLLQNHVVLKSDVPLYDQNCHLLGYIKAGSVMYETAHDTRKKVKQYLRKTAPLLGLSVCEDECYESSNASPSPPLSPDGGASPTQKLPSKSASLQKLHETLARIQSVL